MLAHWIESTAPQRVLHNRQCTDLHGSYKILCLIINNIKVEYDSSQLFFLGGKGFRSLIAEYVRERKCGSRCQLSLFANRHRTIQREHATRPDQSHNLAAGGDVDRQMTERTVTDSPAQRAPRLVQASTRRATTGPDRTHDVPANAMGRS